jgi:uncharacterized protein (DUF1697 family)
VPPGASSGDSLLTYVALLRAVNLGSRNKISMPKLREAFGALGAQDVSTYVQSGNVVFRSPDDSPSELVQAIEQQLASALSLDVSVLLRTAAELERVFGSNPFAARAEQPRQLHVTFLDAVPDAARVGALDPRRSEPDEFRVVEREIYLHCPNGYGRSKLTNAYFEKQLGVIATTRNWNTVTKLAELTRD